MRKEIIFRIIRFFLKISIYYFIIIEYHILVESNLYEFITQIDIKLTTGFKPSLPVVEFGVSSLILSTILIPDLFPKSGTPNLSYLGKLLTVIKLLLLTLPPISIQFLHLYYDHNGRWRFLESWTYPGSYISIHDTVPWLSIFYLSVIGIGISIGIFHLKRIEKYFKS